MRWHLLVYVPIFIYSNCLVLGIQPQGLVHAQHTPYQWSTPLALMHC